MYEYVAVRVVTTYGMYITVESKYSVEYIYNNMGETLYNTYKYKIQSLINYYQHWLVWPTFVERAMLELNKL